MHPATQLWRPLHRAQELNARRPLPASHGNLKNRENLARARSSPFFKYPNPAVPLVAPADLAEIVGRHGRVFPQALDLGLGDADLGQLEQEGVGMVLGQDLLGPFQQVRARGGVGRAPSS